jgi:predicted RNA-binding Zn ribbon-like protein
LHRAELTCQRVFVGYTRAVASAPYTFDLSGGAICLAFVNTLGDRPRGTEEHLRNWPDLIAWGEQAGLVSPAAAARLRSEATKHPKIAARSFQAAIELRELIYAVVTTAAHGRRIDDELVAAFNLRLRGAMAHAALERRDDAFVWSWAPGEGLFDAIEWPVVRSMADLITSEKFADVRECASDTCSWTFLDRSPTRARRWCSMKGCGNRAKARRFQARRKAVDSDT